MRPRAQPEPAFPKPTSLAEPSVTADGGSQGGSEVAPAALATALELSHDVKAKVEACGDDLASTNDQLKSKIADGATTLAADETLAGSEAVEAQVQECVEDLHLVTKSLAEGVNDHLRIETALTESKEALASAEAALAISVEHELAATRRALHDALTGLPNRALFDDRLQHGIALAQRHGWTLAVMFFDLDRFKSINDTHGHAAGDAVLIQIAGRLLSHARDEDTVCRTGGDEFLYLLMNPQGQENIARIAAQVAESAALPMAVGQTELVLTLSIGIAIYPDHATDGEELIRQADSAMYRAKAKGSRVEIFAGP